jgi:DNA helicase-2/ATP-dependent DNA helicase PcrA
MERGLDDDGPGFRFGRFGSGREIPSRTLSGRNDRKPDFSSMSMGGRRPEGTVISSGGRRPESRNLPESPRPLTREEVLRRPLPPKAPDAEFIPDPMSSFHVGDSIEHNRFGVGKVLSITGEVPEIKAKIAFEKYGEKILLLKYAKIRHFSLHK